MDFAHYFGCNAFLARLASHGVVTTDPLLEITPDRLYESAKEALMVARQLGKKVVVMAWMVAFEKAGNHVIACDLTSGAVPDVRSQTFAFAKEVLGMMSNR